MFFSFLILVQRNSECPGVFPVGVDKANYQFGCVGSTRTFSSDFSVLAVKLFQSDERDKGERKKKISFPSELIMKCYEHWASAEITADNNTRSREPVKRPSNQNEHKKLTRWILVLRESVQIQVCCLFHLKEKERLHFKFVSISFIFKQSQFFPTSKESLH